MVAMRPLCSFLFIFLCCYQVKSDCDFKSCRVCIASSKCVWCSKDNLAIQDRCKVFSNLNKDKDDNLFMDKKIWCESEHVQNPQNFNNTIQDDPFEAKGKVVQLRPQIIEIRARPQRPVQINISYRPALDYPLDVYMLMDTSFTMKVYVTELKKQASEIYNELKEYTNNIHLGLGSFIEKAAFPYFDKFNIDDYGQHYESYAYKSHVLLSNKTNEFESAINAITFGSNNDEQEAGLDALMQVMTCVDKLSWRDKNSARRIIVLCTDIGYHMALDGRPIGIIKPNDMMCHLEGSGNNLKYTTELKQDYPSVSQINKIATDGNYIIIFLAKPKVSAGYTALAEQITGAKYAELKEQSNVVDIIKKSYKDAMGRVKFRVSGLPPYVDLKFDPDCNEDATNLCTSTPEDPTVKVIVTLTVNSCPPDDKFTKEIKISPVGLDDKVTVKLTLECACGCEKNVVEHSPICSNAGSYQCGTCKCDENRFGDDCSCDNIKNDFENYEKCKAKKDDSQPCSGRGLLCRCGKCEKCMEGFSGDYCEFDNKACPGGELCFGHGTCYRGQCSCNPGWEHPHNGTSIRDCSCPLSTDSCKTPRSDAICSGNGECVCGKCVCDKSEGKKYYGAYCDNEQRCQDLGDYVFCNHDTNDQALCDKQFNYTGFEVNIVNKDEFNGPNWYKGKWCKKDLDGGKYIVFKYLYRGQTMVLAIQKEPELRPEPDIWTAVGSAIGAILLIGLLTLLLWKILVDILDKREFQRFSEESAAMGFDVSQNPLYETPATNFENPAYNM